MRHIGRAIQLHDDSLQHFPHGGWGFLWLGDPDRGKGREQPGGWTYNLLPYAGYEKIHDIGSGLNGEEKIKVGGEMTAHGVPLFECPGRRNAAEPIAYNHRTQRYRNYYPSDFVGKGDYAGCAGDHYPEDAEANWGPRTYEIADAEENWETAPFWIIRATQTGVFYQASLTRSKDVVDGLGKTFFVGEKYLDPLRYRAMVTTFGDNQHLYIGADSDTVRWTGHFRGHPLLPIADREGFQHDESFGSNHPAGCNFLLGDGSVETVAYDVDPVVFMMRSNRKDSSAAAEEPGYVD
ncbi:DUF1559 family PulG-like putative transporter [Botrimarina hoheduenensis]|uniref:DUF1559 family PulG-like putative transporter n=1 Tax=Botrimarina hoheduenensis TaxID=2528000 RepID=UPI001E3B4452|nr:DUF1559 domain-containing protein [Botrimarina hoheduenensis]